MSKQVTSISAWRKRREEGELYTLPSGNVALLQRVHIMALVEQGQVPDTLTNLVAQMVSENPRMQISMKDLKHYAEVVNLVVCAAFVAPVVRAEPGEGSLGVQELDFSDRVAVFEWCHLPTRKLEPFRPEQG
jgi:hypothetical protein